MRQFCDSIADLLLEVIYDDNKPYLSENFILYMVLDPFQSFCKRLIFFMSAALNHNQSLGLYAFYNQF